MSHKSPHPTTTTFTSEEVAEKLSASFEGVALEEDSDCDQLMVNLAKTFGVQFTENLVLQLKTTDPTKTFVLTTLNKLFEEYALTPDQLESNEVGGENELLIDLVTALEEHWGVTHNSSPKFYVEWV